MKQIVLLLMGVILQACSTKPLEPSAQAVASAHPAATSAGLEILNQGGNAFDAAIAVSAALAVVEPYGSGIGGGGFWLLHRAEDGKQIMIDGREVAPDASRIDMYLDAEGNPVKGASVNGALSAGIPGMPAALVHLSKKYGKLPLEDSLHPAIKLAEQGFTVNKHYQRLAKFRHKALLESESATQVFLINKEVPKLGQLIIQKDLAKTLSLLGRDGFDGFYTGEMADRLVKGVGKAGGIWSKKDLADYQIKEREPVVIHYNDMKITTAALPSSGGLVMSVALNILNDYPLADYDQATRTHVVIEAMRRAYRDRALYMGDPDFVQVPTKKLTDKAMLKNWRRILICKKPHQVSH